MLAGTGVFYGYEDALKSMPGLTIRQHLLNRKCWHLLNEKFTKAYIKYEEKGWHLFSFGEFANLMLAFSTVIPAQLNPRLTDEIWGKDVPMASL